MQSGFTGGGGGSGGLPEFYTNRPSIAAATAMNGLNPSESTYGNRSPNLPGLFLEHANSRLARQSPHATTLIGKRTLTEFQTHGNAYSHGGGMSIPNHQAFLQANYLRSVKPRSYQNSSPISPLSPAEFSPTTPSSENNNSSSLSPPSQRYGLPTNLQHLRPQTLPYGVANVAVQNRMQTVQAVHNSEKKMIDHKLQELEKQLLDDDDEGNIVDGEADPAASAITAVNSSNSNSEWSETIQNLIVTASNQKPPVSPSPTSSSSSSSSTVASPAAAVCIKQQIIEAASAISDGKTESAAEILTRIGQFAPNPKPTSEQKVLEFTVSALKSRVSPFENPPPVKELFSQEHAVATQSLYDLAPCFNLGFSAANLAILDATLSEQSSQRVHVIDFDIGQGGQYASLLHSLAARQKINGESVCVKITTTVDPNERDRLKATTEKLAQLGENLGVRIEINAVSVRISELSRETLALEPDEPVAVNFAFKLYRTADESVSTENPRDELLRRVKAMKPRVVVLVEQEVNTNTAPFMARVNETCSYYAALLESVEASSSARSASEPERVKAAEVAVSRKVGNSVACEGRERVERCEVFGKWKARMGMAGFELRPLSQNVKTRLSSGNNRVNPGFSVKEENGGICFGWMGRTLTVASTWR